MAQVTIPDAWKPHPRFREVFLKSLVTGADNPGLAVNLIRLAPGSEIVSHTHADATETFYILKGQGIAWIDGAFFELAPGVCGFAPPSVTHSVCNTGAGDLEALAIFNPPI